MTSPAPIVLAEQEGEPLWFNRDLLTFKATSEQTNGAFLLFEESSQRGKMTPVHTHPNEDETFYVLEGEMRVHIDGSDHVGGPGSFISIPRGVPHAMTVTSDTARALTLLTPGSAATGGLLPRRRRAGPRAQATAPRPP